MKNTTIRFRADQTAFIAQVIRERDIDLSGFVRLCVDSAAPTVAKMLPIKIRLSTRQLVSLPQLQAAAQVKRSEGNGHTNGRKLKPSKK